MYRVSSVPRPSLVPFLLQCVWFGAMRNALYGLLCGAGYGAFFFLIGAFYGAPIGLAFGAVVGALNGLICGVILYGRMFCFSDEPDQPSTSDQSRVFRAWMGGFSFVSCLIGGLLVFTDGRSVAIGELLNASSLFFVIIPSLIAGLCGDLTAGHLLEWSKHRFVSQPGPSPSQRPDERM